MATNENSKHAASLIKEYNYDINDYPEVKERLMKASMRFYLSRFLYKKPNSDEFLSLDRIEDMFLGFAGMLTYLVEDLVFKEKINEAKGIAERHKLYHRLRPDVL